MLTTNESKANLGAHRIGTIMSESIQKVIKIGSSLGVTIPAKDAKRQGIKPGDEVKFTVEPVMQNVTSEDQQILDAAKKILTEYKKDFKNLSQR